MTNIIFSAYCYCTLCCGPAARGINAAGYRPIEGRSIAGPRSIPLGTRVVVRIPGLTTNTFNVDDRTARRWDGRRWDIYIDNHRRARQFGLRRGSVQIVE